MLPSSTRLVDSANMAFICHANYYVSDTLLGSPCINDGPKSLPWYSALNVLFHVIFEVLMAFPGVFPYVCVVTLSCPEIYMKIVSLKAIALSAIVIEVSVQQCVVNLSHLKYCFMHEATLTGGRSFYAYRIYLLSKGSLYLPAAIVRIRNLSRVARGTYSHEQSTISLTTFVTGIGAFLSPVSLSLGR
ncbi:hypothetical protein EI94DRAFT_1722289 [Lactarius quietus]|nr:hypothetical protein EI94DRAFT_1722289 [Lactarius quietus]